MWGIFKADLPEIKKNSYICNMGAFNDFMTQIDFNSLHECCMLYGTVVEYSRGEHFALENEVCRNIGFVRKGYFKFVGMDSAGEEHVTGFSFTNEVVSDYVRSFLYGLPSFCSIIAGSTAEVLQVPITLARDYIKDRDPDFVTDTSSILLMTAYRRYLNLHTLSPLERYKILLNEHPSMVRHMPIQEIASFLNISRRQFHRIRELANKD